MLKLIRILINPQTLSSERAEPAYKQQVKYFKKVWNDDTYGIERITRLALCGVQFIFPILLVRELSGKLGVVSRKLAVELYTLLKLIFPLVVLIFGLYRYPIAIAVVVYLLSETILHILNLIFLYDIHSATVSYHRSLLLLFLHYLEVVLDFSTIYIGFDLLSEALTPVSAVYFSLVANSTVGFGDIHAKGASGQLVVIAQLIVCVLFIILFINHFSQKKIEY
jgi:hypothetical protein